MSRLEKLQKIKRSLACCMAELSDCESDLLDSESDGGLVRRHAVLVSGVNMHLSSVLQSVLQAVEVEKATLQRVEHGGGQ